MKDHSSCGGTTTNLKLQKTFTDRIMCGWFWPSRVRRCSAMHRFCSSKTKSWMLRRSVSWLNSKFQAQKFTFGCFELLKFWERSAVWEQEFKPDNSELCSSPEEDIWANWPSNLKNRSRKCLDTPNYCYLHCIILIWGFNQTGLRHHLEFSYWKESHTVSNVTSSELTSTFLLFKICFWKVDMPLLCKDQVNARYYQMPNINQ